jgi:uncharacterized membrane protein
VTGLLRLGRGLFCVLVIGLVTLLVTTMGRLPPVVASHFDATGTPNGWSSREVYVVLILIIGAVLPLGIVWLVHTVTRHGPQLLNIPARDYWRRPEHGAEAVRRARGYMWWLACIMAGTSLAVHGLIVGANASTPPRLSTPAIVTLLGAVLMAIGLWSVGWWLLLRPPRAA